MLRKKLFYLVYKKKSESQTLSVMIFFSFFSFIQNIFWKRDFKSLQYLFSPTLILHFYPISSYFCILKYFQSLLRNQKNFISKEISRVEFYFRLLSILFSFWVKCRQRTNKFLLNIIYKSHSHTNFTTMITHW